MHKYVLPTDCVNELKSHLLPTDVVFYLILRQVGDNVPGEVLQNLFGEYGVVGGVHPNILRPRGQPKSDLMSLLNMVPTHL
jgi:hypothetical protein